MMITRKDLEEIEKAVGYDCTAGIKAGYGYDGLIILVYAFHPSTGVKFSFEQTFTDKQIMFCSPILLLDAFKRETQSVFYEEFA